MSQTPQPPPAGEMPGPAGEAYPLAFDVAYPDRELNRVSTGFRVFAVIPIAIVLAAVGGGHGWGAAGYGAGAGGILFIPALLMILFRQKYPRWWFDWNRELCASLTSIAGAPFRPDFGRVVVCQAGGKL